MSKTLQFKTNINCGNCVKSITPFLNDVTGIERWEVNTQTSDKILTIVANDDLDATAVIDTVEDAGFDIEPMQL